MGVTLDIDKSTVNRPESVRIKLGCRDAENIPEKAEGVLGDHFYDFFYSVDKILVKNPPKDRSLTKGCHQKEPGSLEMFKMLGRGIPLLLWGISLLHPTLLERGVI